MKDVNCKIAEDLFVSYRDRMTTEETTAMMQEHLAECTACEKKYAKFLLAQEEAEKKETDRGKQFQEKLLSYRTYGIGFLIGLFLPVILLAGLYFLQVLNVAIQEHFLF